MYDLYVPNERYEAEIVKLKTTIDGVDENKELVFIFHQIIIIKYEIYCWWIFTKSSQFSIK